MSKTETDWIIFNSCNENKMTSKSTTFPGVKKPIVGLEQGNDNSKNYFITRESI